ncbi:hypothetical protein AAG565_12510 [Fontimonas sp. SYSU GA230001]|uniref:SMP-30/gluconolactonase/LRE family protein n=1 Tax=Fontimonas sp. SYSU GA230001 TaxID=3142450 RepID=UPI0032B338D1
MRTLLLPALALLLASCGGHDDGASDDTPPDPASLCVSSACGSKTALLTIPDAENILFTPDGRLFVSGGTNVFEILATPGGGYEALALYDGNCNFTGLALRGDVLYANCFDGRLYAARLTAAPQLAPIHELNLAAPNGLVDGPDGELYLVNGPLATSALPDPKVVRLRLDPADPFKVVEQVDWFSEGLLGPNGIQRRGRTLYVSNTGLTSLGEIRSVEIGADGAPGASARLASFTSIPDDFSVVGDALLVAWYSSGQIALIGADGSVLQSTAPSSFDFPSQVRAGRPPLFAATDLLVTEKGMIGDTASSYGNRLSLFRATP